MMMYKASAYGEGSDGKQNLPVQVRIPSYRRKHISMLLATLSNKKEKSWMKVNIRLSIHFSVYIKHSFKHNQHIVSIDCKC